MGPSCQGPEDLQGGQHLADRDTRSPHQGSLAAGERARETWVCCWLFWVGPPHPDRAVGGAAPSLLATSQWACSVAVERGSEVFMGWGQRGRWHISAWVSTSWGWSVGDAPVGITAQWTLWASAFFRVLFTHLSL